jgi:hypothetical protein
MLPVVSQTARRSVGRGGLSTNSEFIETISLRSFGVESDEDLTRLVFLLHHFEDSNLKLQDLARQFGFVREHSDPLERTREGERIRDSTREDGEEREWLLGGR